VSSAPSPGWQTSWPAAPAAKVDLGSAPPSRPPMGTGSMVGREPEPQRPATPAEARESYLSGLDPDDELLVRKVSEKAGLGSDDYTWVILDALTRATNSTVQSQERIALRTIQALESVENRLTGLNPEKATLHAILSLRTEIASQVADTSAIIVERRIKSALDASSKSFSESIAQLTTAATAATNLLRSARSAPIAYAVVISVTSFVLGFIAAHL
jgi:hypothetical protein